MELYKGIDPDSRYSKALLEKILLKDFEHLSFMEVCGTHTMAISRFGIRRALSGKIELHSGPGCPVCITDDTEIDLAIRIAGEFKATLCTFGDMMRVPGSSSSLLKEKAMGSRVVVVYSPLDALDVARQEDRQVVFLSVGFETTVPSVALTIMRTKREGVNNLSFLSLNKTIPPALRFLCENREVRIDGFILPGHVSAIIGVKPYEFIPSEFGIPCVVSGFEQADILSSILMLMNQHKRGEPEVRDQYFRGVRREGNLKAQEVIEEVFEPCDSQWRGIGMLKLSGLRLKDKYKDFDAIERFNIKPKTACSFHAKRACRCGEVLIARIKPPQCPLFAVS
jgi:hydrogenase expression/formation protein HypD